MYSWPPAKVKVTEYGQNVKFGWFWNKRWYFWKYLSCITINLNIIVKIVKSFEKLKVWWPLEVKITAIWRSLMSVLGWKCTSIQYFNGSINTFHGTFWGTLTLIDLDHTFKVKVIRVRVSFAFQSTGVMGPF